MRLLLLLTFLIALPAQAQHKPWGNGVIGTGAVQWVPPQPSRDAGASYPVIASANSGTITSVATTNTLATSTASTLVVVLVGMTNSIPTAWGATTVAWTGANASCGSFTARIEQVSSAGNYRASIWTALCSSTFSGKGITVSATTGSGGSAMVVAVDALVGAVVGVTSSKTWSTSTANSVVLNGTSPGSWLYVVSGNESVLALTPVANTTEIQDVTDGAAVDAATGVNTAGAQYNITVGWSTTSTWGAIAALEIKRG